LDLGERFLFLDSLMRIARYGVDYLEGLSATKGQKPASPDVKQWRAEVVIGIDWDQALRKGNRWYDRLVAPAREKDPNSRKEKADQIEADLKALKKNFVDKGRFAGLLFGDAGKKGEVIGDMVACLLVPAVGRLASAADRYQQIQDNVIVAFALALYE